MANDIEINVRVANNTRAGLSAIQRSMDGLRQHARTAGTSLTALAPRATAAAAALEVLAHAADEAGDALRTLQGRASLAGVALAEVRTSSQGTSTSLRSVSRSAGSADTQMEALTGRTRALRDNMNELDGTFSRAGASMGTLRGNLGTLSTSAGGAADGQQRLIQAAVALGPALIPIAASIAPVAVGLGAAAVAAGAFGAALAPQLLAMGKITEAQKAYSESLEENGRYAAETAQAENEWLKQVQKASPEVRKAAASLSVMKDQYKGWTDSLAGDTLPVATKSFAAFGALFPKMTPLVQGASGQLSRFVTLAAGGIQSPAFDRFMDSFSTFATETLAKANSGLVRFATNLDAGKMSSGIAEFMRYAKENGPLVAETLGNLGEVLVRIVRAAADTGVSVLSLVNAFAGLVNAIPTGLLTALVQTAVALNAVKLAAAGFAVVGPAMLAAAGGIRTFIASARFAGLSMAISGVAASLTALQKASVVVAVIAGIGMAMNSLAEKARGAPPDVDKLTLSLKELGATGKFTGELKKSFGDMDGLVQKMGQLQEATKKAGDAGKGAFGFKIPVLDDIGNWLGTKSVEMAKGEESARALGDAFKGIDAALANVVKSGNADLAAAAFDGIAESAAKDGRSLQEVKDLMPSYGEALANVAAEQEITARSMGLFGEQAVAVQAKLDLQKQSADGLRQSIQALNDANRSALDGMIGFEAAIDAAAKGAAENAGSLDMVNGVLDLNGEKARTAASLLSALAAKTGEAALAARENGASWETVGGIYERAREQMIANAREMGLNKDQAKALTDQLLAAPGEMTSYLRGDIKDLDAKLKDARARLAAAPSSKQVAIRAEISDLLAKKKQAQAALDSLDSKTVYIRTIYQNFTSNHPGGQAQAHGGIIGAAGGGPRSRMTLVGEQGPELVDLAPGSRVRSNPDSKRIAAGMAGGGGGGGPILVQVMLDGRQLAQVLVDPLQYEIGTRGGNVQSVLGKGTGS
ncbi:hypothetical protein [Streptomyces sp. NBC_01264]|uniref:hypothetical protein n=1 Tax=Streptomyces sp. NBC_01264 TaxID=2903804 RepID=UPI002258AD57|nr:hypothetical protein [Streptomyces sp. NBC_01264]MCX4780122.1 hypothetical protein [Streptomyces sp. NBC_01264]